MLRRSAATRLNRAHDQIRSIAAPEAPHGFHADYRGSYRKDAAEDAWKQAQAWFKKHGVPS
ncbi:dienelactone hydrolase family protein [Bradyrhizobium cosmicum]|uniref:dienelactone hydrolase family protein n=1 Tax=Bradyrhizobium cosmicum TaxID=1404864 RepID=UPI0039657DEA